MTESLPNIDLPESKKTKKTINKRRSEPSNHDEIINDILKHLTTLNTGLLAILSIFNEQIGNLLQTYKFIGEFFLSSFYFSLLLCMIGFILTIISLHIQNSTWRRRIKFLRDIVILVAALAYIAALMLLVTLYSSAFGIF